MLEDNVCILLLVRQKPNVRPINKYPATQPSLPNTHPFSESGCVKLKISDVLRDGALVIETHLCASL